MRPKILCIGAGSMGRRRLRDVTYLDAGEVILHEAVADRCRQVAEAFGIRGTTDLDAAFAENPAVVLISTPPTAHDAAVRRVLASKLHLFAEVPFVMDAGLMREIASAASNYPAVLGISHTLRYYPPYRIIHDLLHEGAIGKPLYFEYSLGNHLADWHPYESYKNFYGSDARLGGAGFDMILHEFAAIQWWMGPIRSVLARLDKVSGLEINGPDEHDVLLKFANGARGFFHDDVIELGTMGRHVRIAGDKGTIEWHQNLPFVRLYDGDQKQHMELSLERAADWDAALEASREMTKILARQRVRSGTATAGATPQGFTYESCYLREMRHFFGAVQGRHPYHMATTVEEWRTVQAFHAVTESNRLQREVEIDTAAP